LNSSSELLVKSRGCVATQRQYLAAYHNSWWGLGLSIENARCRICLSFLLWCDFKWSYCVVGSGRRA